MDKPATAAVDVIYIATCARDARLARICIASIRYFYPSVPIRLLAGGPLRPGFVREVARHWNVQLADNAPGVYGWGYAKLEPLFGTRGQRFMVCDADTVFTGPVLDAVAGRSAPFIVDHEDMPDSEARQLYFDTDRIKAIDPDAPRARGVFNSGQWFGTAGVIGRESFDPWLEWTMPRQQRHPNFFMGGDQGILNYVLLRKEAREGLPVERIELMRWPGRSIDDLTLERVRSGTAPARVIHWAGVKSILLRNMAGGDLLQFFEDSYFAHLPFGRLRRRLELWRHVAGSWMHKQSMPYRLLVARWRSRLFPGKTPREIVKRNMAT